MRLTTAAETWAFGARLGRLLQAGDLVLLSGPLGAGKTQLTQGIAAGLDVTGPVTSPTFVLAREHRPLGDGPWLVHADAYRLGGALELDDLDLDTDRAVVVVEWGEGIAEGLAGDGLVLRLTPTPDPAPDGTWPRDLEIVPRGPRGAALAAAVDDPGPPARPEG